MRRIEIVTGLIVVLFFGCMTLGALAFVPSARIEAGFMSIFDTFEITTKSVFIVAGVVAGIWLIASLIYFLAIGWQYWQRASHATVMSRLRTDEYRIQIRRQQFVIESAPAGNQVYKLDVLENVTDPLHLSPGRVNGLEVEPGQRQLSRWWGYQITHASARPPQLGPAAQPGPGGLTTDQAIPPLLDALAKEQRLLLLGPSGSGKSSLLRHVVSRKLDIVDQVILCDPHGSRPKWGSAVDAIGFGEDFAAILDCFQRLEWLHKQRIEQVADGHPERDFPIILVVIEEIQAMVEHFTDQKVDIGHYLKMFLTRTRKTGIDVLAVTQADTVGALGLKGFRQNKEAFALARTVGRDGRGHRVEYQNEYGEVHQYEAPSLWPDTLPVGVTQEKVARLAPAPTIEQLKIINVLSEDPGASNYQVCQAVFDGKRNPAYYARVDEVRELFGPF